MKIYVLGSCSGTEPMPDRHHTSVAIEINDRFYWFDAGENCAYTAHMMGLDVLKIKEIFISHGHMDHVGGLGNLLWTIYKMTYVTGNLPAYGDVNVHMPNDETFDGVLTILKNAEGKYESKYNTFQLYFEIYNC